MAKNWVYVKSTKTLIRTYWKKEVDPTTMNEVVVKGAPDLSINLELLCPSVDFTKVDEVELNLIINGTKQKLDDSIARSKEEKLTEPEKREVQEALLQRMRDARKWNMKATGGARGLSVPLKVAIPPLVAAGFSVEKLADMFGKTVAVIEKFIETGEEEDQTEENTEENSEEDNN